MGRKLSIWAMCMVLVLSAGCAALDTMDKSQKGALGGAAVGALVGQLIGHNTAGTLIGTGVGLGLGYIIGNEMDKADAKSRTALKPEEKEPLAGTTWQVVSVVPKPKQEMRSVVTRFGADGTATTTKTHLDGKVEEDVESYRIVGSTLIFNKNHYVINTRFQMDGDKLYLDTGEASIVMKRI